MEIAIEKQELVLRQNSVSIAKEKDEEMHRNIPAAPFPQIFSTILFSGKTSSPEWGLQRIRIEGLLETNSPQMTTKTIKI